MMRDVADPLLVRAQRQRLAHDLVHVDHRARRLALARERQQVADDPRGALRLAEDRLEAALGLLVDRSLRQPLGPGQDRRERVVQLVRDAGDRLAERGHLLGLQQLVIEVARLILELLALADVAHQRFDAQRAVGLGLGVRRHLDPDRRRVGAAQAQQVVGDRAVALQPLDEARRAPADRRSARARTAGPRPPASRPRSRTSASGEDWRRASSVSGRGWCRCRRPRGRLRTAARRPRSAVESVIDLADHGRRRRHRRERAARYLRSIAARISAIAGARRMHLHRVTRDVEADRSTNAVRFPHGRPSLRVARRDEAVVVVPCPRASQPQKHGTCAQHFGMLAPRTCRRRERSPAAARRRTAPRAAAADLRPLIAGGAQPRLLCRARRRSGRRGFGLGAGAWAGWRRGGRRRRRRVRRRAAHCIRRRNAARPARADAPQHGRSTCGNLNIDNQAAMFDQTLLQDQVAVITGGGTGIGLAIARRLGRSARGSRSPAAVRESRARLERAPRHRASTRWPCSSTCASRSRSTRWSSGPSSISARSTSSSTTPPATSSAAPRICRRTAGTPSSASC